jgi:hypothetical protein
MEKLNPIVALTYRVTVRILANKRQFWSPALP